MKPRSYATPLAFKTAVEQRLRGEASSLGIGLQRRRQLFVFDRYLARLFRVLGDAVVLKGGMVIELRLDRARTTRDIDLHMTGDAAKDSSRARSTARLSGSTSSSPSHYTAPLKRSRAAASSSSPASIPRDFVSARSRRTSQRNSTPIASRASVPTRA